MYTILLVVQVIIALSLITLVLLQHGKGADMGAAFGSGASSTVFGARGAGSFFTRATAVLATLFFINCILIASPLVTKGTRSSESVIEQLAPPPATEEVEVTEERVVPDIPDVPADLPSGADDAGLPGTESDLPE